MRFYLQPLRSGLGLVVLLTVVSLVGSAVAGNTRVLTNSTPSIVNHAQNLGPEDPSKVITITVWLQEHNSAALDQLAKDMYTKTSANYHKWITPSEFYAQFGPGSGDAATVKQFLTSHGLSIVGAHKNNLYIRASGTVSDIQNAFHVQLNKFNVNGKTVRANTNDPMIDGPAGDVIKHVGGLHEHAIKPGVVRPVNPDTGVPYAPVPLASAGPNGAFYSGNCLRNPVTEAFTTNLKRPSAVYTGLRYGSDITAGPPNLPPCGYDPYEIDTAYGMIPAFNHGYAGQGESVVIVDAWGSDSIQYDAAFFSGFYGLPAPNITLVYPQGVVTCAGAPSNDCINGSWNVETTLDVEWAHSIAPGANIVVEVAQDNNNDNLFGAIVDAVDKHYGPVISNSWGDPECDGYTPSDLDALNAVSQFAAMNGISVNFSSGDSGDYAGFCGSPYVSVGASSPYSTAVGGTSLFINTSDQIKMQTGWGNNLTRLTTPYPQPQAPLVPPVFRGFVYGAGGGVSSYYPKPAFQSSLPGSYRLVPDIAWLADPYTGVEIIISPDGVPTDGTFVDVIGGTSLACPMFSAIWAIANQAASASPKPIIIEKPHWLGQAAPLLYSLPAGAILDVTDVTSPFSAHGTIFNADGSTTVETAADLMHPETSAGFVNMLYQYPYANSSYGRWYALSFGTDSSLFTAPGWDDVTGLGTPNGLNFINAVATSVKK